jgi:hypothetical protein
MVVSAVSAHCKKSVNFLETKQIPRIKYTEGQETDSATGRQTTPGKTYCGVGVTVGVAAPGAGGVCVALTLCAGVGVLIPSKLLSLEQLVTVVDKSKTATRTKTWILFIFSSRIYFHSTIDNRTLADASAMKPKPIYLKHITAVTFRRYERNEF